MYTWKIHIAAVAFLWSQTCMAALPENVSSEKVRDKPWMTAVLQHAGWPAESAIVEKGVDSTAVSREIAILKRILTSSLRDQYQPEASLVTPKSIVAVTNLYNDGSDYLLLRYSVAQNVEVMVQDGKTLCLTIKSPEWASAAMENIGAFVCGIAASVLRYPSEVKEGDLDIFVSAMDIGDSKWGCVTWEKENMSRFSSVWWWSDGKSVLFSLQKATEKEFLAIRQERRASAAPSPDRQDRKFGRPWWGNDEWAEPTQLEKLHLPLKRRSVETGVSKPEK